MDGANSWGNARIYTVEPLGVDSSRTHPSPAHSVHRRVTATKKEDAMNATEVLLTLFFAGSSCRRHSCF